MFKQKKIYSLILASSRKNSNLFNINKAFLKLKDKYLIQYILDAFNIAKLNENLYISLRKEEEKIFQNNIKDFFNYKTFFADYDFAVQTVINFSEVLEFDDELLISSCDNVFLTSSALKEFSENINAELTFGFVKADENLFQKFPELKRLRSWYRINNQTYISGANLFYLKKSVNKNLEKLACNWEKNRKSMNLFFFKQIIKTMNFKLLLDFILGKMTLNQCNDFLTNIFQIKTEIKILNEALLCLDIDKPLDLIIAEKIIKLRKN